MKIPSLLIGLTAVGFGLTLTFLPRVFAEDKDCKIMIQFKRVLMPVTNLTPEDVTELDGLLQNFRESTYKIVKFKNGVKVPGSDVGILDDKRICEEAAIFKAAQASKASGVAIQIGGFGCTPACQQHFGDDELVTKVEALLKKYCDGKSSEQKKE